jgi:cytochrome c-type biogenesis protein CcmH/NrfG
VKPGPAAREGTAPSFHEFLESKGASLIVTNAHVVSEGLAVQVKQGEKSWQAEIKQIDPRLDLCLLKVEGLSAPSVPMRASDTVTIGERVYAIGAPEGLELTLSDGLVSGFRHRNGQTVIQTTAPISHGSSGGGLFDSDGKLIGITTFFLSDSQNLNFAIPTDNIDDLSSETPSQTAVGWIGIGDQAMNEQAPGSSLGFPPISVGPAQDEWLERAKQQLEILRSYWRRGAHAYQMALRLHPGNFEAWEKLGQAYTRLDDPQRMTDAFQRAIRLKPDDVAIWTNFAEAYERLGDQQGAVDACKRALDRSPRDAALWVNLADAYGKTQSKAAIDALSQAERLEPADGFTWWRIGSTYQLLVRYKEAERAYLQSVRLEPNNSLYMFNLGALYALEHKRSKANEIYERLMQSNPDAAKKLRDLSAR